MMDDLAQFERDLLGHCLSDESALLLAESELSPTDFWLGSHRAIYTAAQKLFGAGAVVNALTLSEELRAAGQLENTGGAAYLVSLTEGLVASSSAVRDYARRIREASGLRRVMFVAETAMKEAALPQADLDALLAETETGLLEIRASRTKHDAFTVRTAMPGLLERMHRERTRTGDLLGLPTGLGPLDTLTRGFQAGELTLVGARSGVGKSCLMGQAAIANCSQGVPVMLISLEMSREQLLRRLIAAVSGVPFPRLKDPKWATDADMSTAAAAAGLISEWPLLIVDDSAITIEKLSAVARLAIRREGVKLVAVDYCQIVGASGRDERLRVAAVSRGLTRLAKDEGVPVLALSQLARSDRSSPNRRPAMSDLRESSQLENDAHVIALLHREWDENDGRLSSEGELIVAKQRSGETGALPVTFNRRSLVFEARTIAAAQKAKAS
jgi:replicative DNA helicase